MLCSLMSACLAIELASINTWVWLRLVGKYVVDESRVSLGGVARCSTRVLAAGLVSCLDWGAVGARVAPPQQVYVNGGRTADGFLGGASEDTPRQYKYKYIHVCVCFIDFYFLVLERNV